MARLLRFGLRLLFAGVLAWGCADTYAGIHVRVAAVENRSVIDVSKQGDADILRAVDRHLLHLKADPESLYYVHSRELEEAGRRRVQLPAWVTWAAGGAVVLLLLALGWAVSLRRASKRIAAVAALAAESEREQRRLNGEVRRIEENSLDLIAVFDAEFRVLRVSGAARELLARAPKDLVGRSCLEWLRPVDRQAGRDFLEQVRRGTPAHSAPSLVWRGDATTRRVLWSLVWSEQEQELYAIGRDDSERHELIKTLKRRREQLELANNDLQTFAQAVSHDLRSPVAAVVGFVDKVLRDEAGNLSERSQNLLARAHSAGQRMDRLIVNLLRFAQLSEAGMRRTDCDVRRHDKLTP